MNLKKQIDAAQYCQNCRLLLCKKHAKLHYQLKGSKDHALLSINEASNEKLKTRPHCPSHPSKYLEYLCNCKMLICNDCATLYHEKHNYTRINEAAEEERYRLSKLIFKTVQDIGLLKKSLDNVNLLIEEIPKRAKKACDMIQNANLNKDNEKVNKLIAKIEEKKEANLDKLKKHVSNLTHLIKKAEYNKKDFQSVVCADNFEVLQMKYKKKIDWKHQDLQPRLETPIQIEIFDFNLNNDKLLDYINNNEELSDDIEPVNIFSSNVSSIPAFTWIKEAKYTCSGENTRSFTIQMKGHNDDNVKYRIEPFVCITSPDFEGLPFNMSYNEEQSEFTVSYLPMEEISDDVICNVLLPFMSLKDLLSLRNTNMKWELTIENYLFKSSQLKTLGKSYSKAQLLATILTYERFSNDSDLLTNVNMSFVLLTVNDNLKTYIREEGGIEYIIDYMKQFPANLALQIEAINALFELADESKTNCAYIEKIRGIGRIIGSMKKFPNDSNLLTKANGALMKISSANGESIKHIMKKGGIERIIKSMKSFPTHPELLAKACAALGNLACEEDCRQRILGLGGSKLIKKSMLRFPKSQELVTEGSRALDNLDIA